MSVRVSRHSIGVVLALCACQGGGDSTKTEDSLGDTGTATVSESAESPMEEGGTDDDADEGEATGDPSTVCAEMTFENVVDEAACPSIQGEGAEPQPADSIEVCRRVFIDLLGESPTAVEYEQHCKYATSIELIDAFMARPEYIRTSQRLWADLFQMSSQVTHWAYIADLDAKVGELYAGTMTLDQLAEHGATHPAFLGRWDGTDLVAFSFRAFLGREATPAEREALLPLWRLWGERPVADPYQSSAMNVVVDTLQCAAPNESLCNSDFWGDNTVLIAPPVPGDVSDPGPNIIDQSLLTPAQWDVLRTPGTLIAEQVNLYESYVDRALVRYLGYDAGTELPLVRQALVELMTQNGGNVRVVDREILTSSLYLSTNRYEEADAPDEDSWDPPYWHGPVKQMDAEDWLRSAFKLAGMPQVPCDHRYPEVQSGAMGFHPSSYALLPSGAPDYTLRDKAQLLGGCPDRVAQFRESRTGLIAALTQATLTADLCAMASTTAPIYPLAVVVDPNDKSEEALWEAVDQVYSAALIRPVMDGAGEGVQQGIELCRDDLSCNPNEFAVQACRLVLKSADFFYY
ncbi:MAG: DUF1549 domain-containing protein [Deltaproteobacteria bacterium]|nr:DUF1549 domain-containing protein [Nannocystaceae bacterium]